MKRKPLTAAKIKNKILWPIFSRFTRLRDCVRTTGTRAWALCISCGRRYHFKCLQAGHFIPGRRNANLFHEKGCHAQCYNCNITLKGNTLEYGDALKLLYGDNIIEELRENEKQFKQFTIPELEEMITIYKIKIKELEG